MDLTEDNIEFACSGSGAQGLNDYKFRVDLFEKIDTQVNTNRRLITILSFALCTGGERFNYFKYHDGIELFRNHC